MKMYGKPNGNIEIFYTRICQMYEVLNPTGSLFFHCNSDSSHIARSVLNEVFGTEAFVAEIIWSYKRWSNSRKGLLPSHQTIYFYAKSSDFKFNQIMNEYSETTNIDQILQRRVRDERGKTVYERDEVGDVVINGAKQGVPLGDVWEIPYLNPKADERVGYPTQKPILLLERIIELVTSPNDWVLDPFCGSGTTVVAALLSGRNAVGIEILPEAVQLAKERLDEPKKTKSNLLLNGRDSYLPKDSAAHRHLAGLEYVPVPRNKGIDGILKTLINGKTTFIRVQREHETIYETAQCLRKATQGKGNSVLLVIQTTRQSQTLLNLSDTLTGVQVIPSLELTIQDLQLNTHST